MLFFDRSQLFVLLAFMLMIDAVDAHMLLMQPKTLWSLATLGIIISFIVADAAIAYKTATETSNNHLTT